MEMHNWLLAKYDVSGIQSYIFATNRLQENVGASKNVGKILKEFLKEAIEEVIGGYQGKKAVTEWEQGTEGGLPLQMEKDESIRIETVYIGGGNAFVLFVEKELYNQVSTCLAKKVLENCRGVNLLTAWVPVKFTNFAQDIESLNREMEKRKQRAQRHLLYAAYPVAEQDGSYGLPVTHLITGSDGTKKASVVQYEKWLSYEKADKGNLAVQMNDLIRKKGEDSYVAVIHIDGNGMGAMVQKALQRYQSYHQAVPEMRNFSAQIDRRNSEAFGRTIEAVESFMDMPILPVRPLLQDGDDLTFICRADLGLCMAVRFLRELLGNSEEGMELSACAGIAYVHSHFPFKIAYEIAESCCSNAKKRWYAQGEKQDLCCLDFQVVRGAYIRQEEQRKKEEAFLARPFLVKAEEEAGAKSLDSFLTILDQVTANETQGERQWPRNRLKRLYEAFHQGETAVKGLEKEYASRGYDLCELSGEKVFTMDSGLYDALEIMDFYDKTICDRLLGRQKTEEEA